MFCKLRARAAAALLLLTLTACNLPSAPGPGDVTALPAPNQTFNGFVCNRAWGNCHVNATAGHYGDVIGQ